MIEIEELGKRFGRQTVLDAVSFRVDAGEVVALAGPNGAGKTTTLRILMGFLAPAAGRARVLGEDPLRRRHLAEIGWMPERPSFPRRFRVRRLIAFRAAAFPGWDAELAGELAERLEVDPTRKMAQLSRGQTARLALLLALAHRPRLLLLDDPTLGLDPKGRRLLLGELLATAAESGSGVLIATHLLAEADWSLDRLLILRQGRIELDEGVDRLKGRCRRLFLPRGAPPPTDLGLVDGAEGPLLTDFDAGRWARYQDKVPAARCEAVGVEDVYVALTKGGQ